MATTFHSHRFVAVLFLLGVTTIPGSPVHALADDEVPQVVRGGGVEVRASRLPPEGQSLRFRIEMDTHMRDLDRYQFEEIVRLRDAAGKVHPPSAVETRRGAGHHRVAILRFPAPRPGTATVELLVRDVAGIPERVFSWDVRGSGAPELRSPKGPPAPR